MFEIVVGVVVGFFIVILFAIGIGCLIKVSPETFP